MYVRRGNVELTADEKALVLQHLPAGVSHTEVDAILAVLGQILTGSSAANEEDIGEQDQVRCRYRWMLFSLVVIVFIVSNFNCAFHKLNVVLRIGRIGPPHFLAKCCKRRQNQGGL